MTRKISISIKEVDLETFDIKRDELLRLSNSLYGLCDGRDYWMITIESQLFDELSISPVIGDTALYIKHKNGGVNGICGSYIDDLLNAWGEGFRRLIERTLKVFESKLSIFDSFDLIKAQVETTATHKFKASQKYFIKSLYVAPLHTPCEDFSVISNCSRGWDILDRTSFAVRTNRLRF